jgi:hypothetical protein
MFKHIRPLIRHPTTLAIMAILLFGISAYITYQHDPTPPTFAQVGLSEREVFNKVFNFAAKQLQTSAWAQPTQTFYSVEEILNFVYVPIGQYLRTSAGGGGTSQAWPDITSGTNTNTLVMGTGGSLSTSGTGTINANRFNGNTTISIADGGTGLSSASDDNIMVGNGTTWQLKALPNCTDTAGQHLNYTAATNTISCGTTGTGGGGTGAFADLTGGTNTTAAMVVGSGGTLGYTGSGTIDASKLGGSDAANYAKLAGGGQQIVTGTQNVARTNTLTIVANEVELNCDTTDIGLVTGITATLNIKLPVCTGSNPREEQEIEFRLFSAAQQGLTYNAAFTNENGLDLPTFTTGDGVRYDRIKFRRNNTTNKWGLVAKTMGSEPGITTLATNVTYTCPHLTSRSCEMTNTEAAGTVTIAIPSGGTPVNGKQLVFKIKCTNAQNITLTTGAGAFIPSPNVPLTGITCPASGTSFTAMAVEYSTVFSAWQLYATN